jgi:hypothetical protein
MLATTHHTAMTTEIVTPDSTRRVDLRAAVWAFRSPVCSVRKTAIGKGQVTFMYMGGKLRRRFEGIGH